MIYKQKTSSTKAKPYGDEVNSRGTTPVFGKTRTLEESFNAAKTSASTEESSKPKLRDETSHTQTIARYFQPVISLSEAFFTQLLLPIIAIFRDFFFF